MQSHSAGRGMATLACTLLALAGGAPLGAQQPASASPMVTGTVVDAGTKRPIPGAQVFVDSGTIGSRANESGRFTIKGLSPGAHTLGARYIGYARASKKVDVSGTGTTTVNFELDQTVKFLDAVVTTGSKAEEEVKAAPTPVNVISAQQIEQQGLTRIDQAFKGQIPGMISLQPGPYDYVSYIFTRGVPNLSGVGKMKVYVDGVEMVDTYYLNNINPASIERMEVIRGPQASTIYGSEAQNGVIQVFTKKGSLNQLTPKTELTLSGGGITGPLLGSQQYKPTADEKISMSGGGQDISYNFGATYQYTGEWTPGYRNKTPSFYGSARTVLGSVAAEVSYRFADRETGGPGNPRVIRQVRAGEYGYPSVFVQDSAFEKQYKQGYSNLSYNFIGRDYGVNLSYTPVADWTHNVVVGISDALAKYVNPPNFFTPGDTLWGNYYSDVTKTSYTYNTNYKAALGQSWRATLTGGGDYWDYTYDVYSASGSPRKYGTVTGTSASIAKYPLHNGGFYEQAELGWNDRLFFTAGARTEFHPGFGKDLSLLDRTAPRVGVAYTADLGGITTKLRASYGTAFTPPTGSQIYTSSSATAKYLPNPDLKPEQQSGGDVGAEFYIGDRYSFSASYFNQYAKDLIAFQYITPLGYVGTVASPAIYQYQNVGEVKNTGVELEGRLNLNALSLSATYTAESSIPKKLYEGYVGFAKVGQQLWRVPKQIAGLNAQYTARRFMLGTDATFIGKRRSLYYGPFYDRIYARYQKNYSGVLDYYTDYFGTHHTKTTFNLNGSVEATSRSTLFARVNNVTNNMLGEFDDDYVVQGRSFSLGIRLRSY